MVKEKETKEIKEVKEVKEEKKDVKKKPSSAGHVASKKGAEGSENFKGIVRIAGRDISGSVKLKRALWYVKGIGSTLAVTASHVLSKELKLAPDMQVGELSDQQIEAIDKILFNLQAHNVPAFLLNRQRDVSDGTNRHVIMSDLMFATSQDIEREKKLYTWKGYRHAYGQKVRGQRTRNTGRIGMALGVMKSKAAPGAAPAPGAAAAAPAGGAAPAKAAGAPAKVAGAAPAKAAGGKPAEAKK